QTEVLGGYEPARYRSERIHATAADGTRVPISLIAPTATPRDGSSPLLLAGYGAYGFPYPVTFSSSRLSLLERGVTFAIAHVRGGGDLGKRWHDAGRMLEKRNTFTDFIACAEHLIARGDTAPDRLVIEGGSAGPAHRRRAQHTARAVPRRRDARAVRGRDQHDADRKSTRLNSS